MDFGSLFRFLRTLFVIEVGIVRLFDRLDDQNTQIDRLAEKQQQANQLDELGRPRERSKFIARVPGDE